MSKKVIFYMILDFIGISATLFVRCLVLNAVGIVSLFWLRIGLTLLINIATIAVCLFIVFFFLLYWWSDKKWTNIKRKFQRRKLK